MTDDKNPKIERLPDGTTREEWRTDGRLHRTDGPASVIRYPDGTVQEEWYRDGRKVAAPAEQRNETEE